MDRYDPGNDHCLPLQEERREIMNLSEIVDLPDAEFLEAIVGRAFYYEESWRYLRKYSITKTETAGEYSLWLSFDGGDWERVDSVIIKKYKSLPIKMLVFPAWTYTESLIDRKLLELIIGEKGAES